MLLLFCNGIDMMGPKTSTWTCRPALKWTLIQKNPEASGFISLWDRKVICLLTHYFYFVVFSFFSWWTVTPIVIREFLLLYILYFNTPIVLCFLRRGLALTVWAVSFKNDFTVNTRLPKELCFRDVLPRSKRQALL